MIKDIIVNLSAGAPHDFTGDFAISVADMFSAHIAGIAFAYEPTVRPTIPHTIVSGLIDAYRTESMKAAKAAVAQFEETTRRAGLSAESRVLTMGVASKN